MSLHHQPERTQGHGGNDSNADDFEPRVAAPGQFLESHYLIPDEEALFLLGCPPYRSGWVRSRNYASRADLLGSSNSSPLRLGVSSCFRPHRHPHVAGQASDPPRRPLA